MSWDHETPIFLDFETQSAADIRETGGRQYAHHESTRVLMLAFTIPHMRDRESQHEYHLWIPNHIQVNTISWNRVHPVTGVHDSMMWPFEMKPVRQVFTHRGELPPDILFDAIKSGCPIVAHNAYMFDRYIWDRFIGFPAMWLDSLNLAKASGQPGKLDTLGKRLLGQGKDRASELMPKLCMGVTPTVDIFNTGANGWTYPTLKNGEVQAFGRYAIGDVEILRRLWIEEFAHLEVEVDIIETHDRINQRGVQVDIPLLQAIEQLSTYSVGRAKNEIAEICGPELNIRSGPQMHEWLESYGIKIVDDNGKACLRKEIVQRYLDSPYLIENHIHTSTEIPPQVLDVLRLRMKALRITSAKVERALERVDKDTHRIYDLHTYHTAHTGRASSMGVQIHNLPRPLKGVDTQKIIDIVHEWNGGNVAYLFDAIKLQVQDTANKAEHDLHNNPKSKWTQSDIDTIRRYSIDDVCSTLLRPSIMAKGGYTFCICDYSQVEARCLAWLADESRLLQKFRDNIDPYKAFGAKLYGCTPEEVTGIRRDVSKVCILGAGYGMGVEKFRVYAANAGVDLVAAGMTAETAISTYRDEHSHIAGFRPDKEKTFRTNGVWHKLDKAVMDCVGSGIATSAAKCTFHMARGDMVCTLPSGRKIYYPSAKVKDVVPMYCYTLGLPPIPKATVVYQSARGEKSLYGGIITENCFDACTKVITNRGIIPIVQVTEHDKVWDGEQWCTTRGCVSSGTQRVGQWLGQLVTGGHLIHDGQSWLSVIQKDVKSTKQSLEWGLHSVRTLLSGRWDRERNVDASVEGFSISRHGNSAEKRIRSVEVAGNLKLRNSVNTPILSRTRNYAPSGPTYTPESYPDAMTPIIEHTRIMGGGVSRYVQSGKRIYVAFFDTLQHLRSGILSHWNLIASKTMETMNRETSVWLHGQKTPTTDGETGSLLTMNVSTLQQNFDELSYQNGLMELSSTIWETVDQFDGYWRDTGRHIPVYDLVNCSSSKFTIVTPYGPVIVHNCDQAICRDVLMQALVKMDMGGLNPVMHVHDEGVNEVTEFDAIKSLQQTIDIMSECPEWATGFPIACEGFTSPRFLKKPWGGHYAGGTHEAIHVT